MNEELEDLKELLDLCLSAALKVGLGCAGIIFVMGLIIAGIIYVVKA